MINRKRYSLACGGLVLMLMITYPLLSQSSDAREVKIEELKTRVTHYFSVLHAGQITKARELIYPESRGTSRAAQAGNTQMDGLRILAVELEEGQESAIVKIRRVAWTPSVAGRIEVREKMRWKLLSGEWFFDPNDPPRTDASIFREYYYDKIAARGNAKPGEGPLPLAVKFHEDLFDFGIAVQGIPVKVRFKFESLSSQDIEIKKIFLPEWFIKDTTQKRFIKPGESGEVQVDLDTSKLYRDVRQDIFVQFEPIKELVKLTIMGKVFKEEDLAHLKKD